MRILDISMPISADMTVYKNRVENKPKLTVHRDFTSSSAYESMLAMHMHTGTHIDAPLHMINDGGTIATVELNKLITWCKVLDLTHVDGGITHRDLKPKGIKDGDFVLLKTKNSYQDTFQVDFVFLEKSGAVYLRDQKIKGVGIDALGIERSQPGHETHIALLNDQIVILEGLRLGQVDEGCYFLLAVPISITDTEAAPVRALLLDSDPLEHPNC